jgi:7-cyano-7-deazaguanine reductase
MPMSKKDGVPLKLPKKWSDPSLLRALPNPSERGYEIKIKNPEITFEGVEKQPDYATAFITIYPDKNIIELRSFKQYCQYFRNKVISYERLINVIYNDLISVYEPKRLRIVMVLSPRGGISSRLAIDSDWSIRGGKEKFKDWVGQSDEW